MLTRRTKIVKSNTAFHSDSRRFGFMARALWSGAIAFGLVNIPAKLYGATDSKDLSFTTLHASCMTALRRPYVCPKDTVPSESKDTVKGYQHAKGQDVILS